MLSNHSPSPVYSQGWDQTQGLTKAAQGSTTELHLALDWLLLR